MNFGLVGRQIGGQVVGGRLVGGFNKTLQQQSFADVLQSKCSSKLIHRKTPVLESLLNKVAGLNRLHHKYLSMIFAKPLRTPYNKTPCTIKIAMANLNQLSYTR